MTRYDALTGRNPLYTTYDHDEDGNEVQRSMERLRGSPACSPASEVPFQSKTKQRGLSDKEVAWLNWDDVGKE